jgi:hypothetical protein
MFILIGTKFFVWGSGLTPIAMNCARCGTTAPFLVKTGMTFLTLFFVIPLLPISGKKPILECPHCKARYDNQSRAI